MVPKFSFACLGCGPGFSCGMFPWAGRLAGDFPSLCLDVLCLYQYWLTREVWNFRFLVHQYLQAFAAVNVSWLERLVLKASVTLKSKIHVQLWHYLHSGLGNNQLNQTGCLTHQSLSQLIPMILEGNHFYSILQVYALGMSTLIKFQTKQHS